MNYLYMMKWIKILVIVMLTSYITVFGFAKPKGRKTGKTITKELPKTMAYPSIKLPPVNPMEKIEKMYNQYTIKVRIYGDIGTTAVGKTLLTDLNQYYSSTLGTGNVVSKTYNYGFGGQAMLQLFNDLDVGIDVGYFRAWSFKLANANGTAEYIINYLNSTFIVEWSPSLFVFQIGAGYYFDVGSVGTHSDLTNYNKGSGFGFMTATGLDFPVTSWLSIPILIRLDMIFASESDTTFDPGLSGSITGKKLGGFTVPVRLFMGMTIRL